MTNNREIIDGVPGLPAAFAPTTQIDTYRQLAAHFLQNILGIDPRAAFITDYSSVLDFCLTYEELEMVYDRIEEVYRVDVSDIQSGFLATIFKRIVQQNGFN